MNFANWKIGHKLAAAFGTLVVVTACIDAFIMVELRQIESARSSLDNVQAGVSALRDAKFYLARQENSFRGYLVTGDPYYLERLDSHRVNFEKEMAEAGAAYAGDPAALAQIETAKTAATAWHTLVEDAGKAIIAGGETSAAAVLVGNDGVADKAIGPAEDAIGALTDSALTRRDVTSLDLADSVKAASLYILLGALASVLAAGLAAWLMTGSISKPIVVLTRIMERLAAGDLSVEIGNRDRKDEIGAMSGAVQTFKDQAIALEASSAAVVDGKNMMVGADRAMGIVEFDLTGNVLRANENFLNVMGYSLAEVQGHHHRMFCDRDYAASPEYAEMWRRLAAGEGFSDRFTRYARGGTKVILDGRYNPIVGADGKPYKIVKFASDQTALELEREKRAETDAAAAREQAEVVNETAAGLSALAAGDLAHRITRTFPGDYARLQVDFNAAMDKLEEAMAVIGTNASAMQSGAGEISQAADDLSRRTEQQAATLEETAAALDEITATVKRTAEGAERAGSVVVGAKAAAEQSGVVVGRAVAAMGEIERSSDQISQIIGVIDEIAFQTNLLALNAGVEAARAGDAGRGFAVVASEVRALAQRSAEAAKEIKGLIAASSGHVKDGVGLVGETGQALTAIVERVSEINGLMAEITASAHEQATALSQVNTAVNQMDQTTQQNAAMVEQSTAASHNLSQEAEELAVLVGKFHVSEDGRAPARSAKAKPNPVRQAQSRIADFARQSSPAPTPAPARRAAGGGASAAMALSNEPQWEQF
ncbi:chemotaxis protein [Brevundimonas sp. LM2]|uniref:methyl-accepting chemotaxis protein n=1 Tax=Brevundimonas sp. LM2 TaxID=1938605 RepID=UPI0009840703|nr:methyl-accepting chemotaxis protein [Brevundimonas sp. LM2]AQR62558.1 chemotaxis protein [Brevundimonas sp. LM2]